MRQKISWALPKPHLGHDGGALLRVRTCDALRYIEEGGGVHNSFTSVKKEYNLPEYAAIQKLWWKRIMLRGDNEAISFTGQHTKFSQGPLCLLLFTMSGAATEFWLSMRLIYKNTLFLLLLLRVVAHSYQEKGVGISQNIFIVVFFWGFPHLSKCLGFIRYRDVLYKLIIFHRNGRRCILAILWHRQKLF